MAESVLSFVVGKLGDAFVKEVLHLYGVHGQVEKVGRDLGMIQAFLKDADRKHIVDERQKQWVKEVRDVAYWIEHVIDTFLLMAPEKMPGKYQFVKRWLRKIKKLPSVHKLGVEINQIEARIQEINERRNTFGTTNLEGEIIRQLVRPIVLPEVDEDDIVGFENDRDAVVRLLLDKNTTRRSVISIVGTGGLGKTTLAKKVYNSETIKDQFKTRVWVVISEKFELIDIVKEIAKQLEIEPPKDVSGYQLTALHQHLTMKKYLIVLDDVWTIDPWTQIKAIFPDKQNGSRILITTRMLNVAKEADPSSVPHILPFLTPEQSIELFMKKALPNQSADQPYPDDLFNIGKQFIKKCDGLPLALVVLGGLLSKKHATYVAWSGLMETMNWGTDGKQCIAVIDSSYEDLSFALKSCFMYFAAFHEDDEIEAISLYQMWIAEGFIPHEENKTLENTAENFLEELVQRNMVQASRRNWDGSIETCRIHDVLHSLAIKKAKEDNFFMAYSKIDELQNYSQNLQTRRLAIHQLIDTKVAELYGKLMSSATPTLRSLLFSDVKVMPKVSQLVYLKVLHSGEPPDIDIEIDYEPEKFGRLNQLLYFRAALKVKSEHACSFQKFIGGMKFLQTLDLSDSSIPCDLPDCVWHVKTLRHVMLPSLVGPPPAIDLTNVQTLEDVRSRESWETTGVPKLPNLKRLGIELCKIQKDTITTLLRTLEHLTDLLIQEVEVPFTIIDMKEFPFYHRLQTLSLWTNAQKEVALDVGMLPTHLTELYLNIFSQEDPMPMLEKLQNLRSLELRGSGFQQMCCSTGGFVQLEQLILGLDEVEEWEIQEGALPMLKELCVLKCHLLHVPRGLQHLTLLQKLRWESQEGPKISKTMENEIHSACKHVPSIAIFPVESYEEQSDEEIGDEEEEKSGEDQSDEEKIDEVQSDEEESDEE
ncbi:Disease resistance family protein [Rhynchospora pubera]|uniref:Disease resistance family protein n=1 Tax=Rhynchospora pubera TaxID=906938 RepID=A0AAV8DF06_9POAL|nr:Disease resistance family protein [Rhynchospora pubera]